jgi:hypothetical protein
MSLASLSSIGSLLSSLAVFGSLIYLALQVRQSDRNQRTLLQQGTSARNVESVLKLAEPHIADIFAKITNGEIDLTPAQAVQLVSLVRASLLGFQDQLLLRKLSLIDATQHESQETVMKGFLSLPAVRALWNMSRDTYAREFSGHIDMLLQNVPLAPPQDLAVSLRTAVGELRAPASA